ncbi:MAG: peptidylprolyl isomerase [Alphaproteobacteria bacterium]|nr:peptidylprolyl isomerase [Alphaproteobacteria bacterium]MBM3951693.1 peptidylprolyl isomerase [Rhodospirillales bacterium]
MREAIQNNKYVELAYRVIDKKSGEILIAVEFPIGYVHGANDILMPSVTKDLEGKAAGDVVEVSFNGDQIYGARDESLVFTDYIENVPEEYRKVGTTIMAENDKGKARSFIVTRIDDKTLTLDGNHPLCGREIVFKLEILNVRDATEEEIEAGGPVGVEPDVNRSLLMPI